MMKYEMWLRLSSLLLLLSCSLAASGKDDDLEYAGIVASASYPFSWTPISEEEKQERRKLYFANGPWCVSPKATMLDLVRSDPGQVLMPRSFLKIAREIYEFELRPDDVIIASYPKCGTTWTQEMVWQILHRVDFDKGRESLLTRSPFLEMQALAQDDDEEMSEEMRKIRLSLDHARNSESPRVIKTHLPLDMLPPNLLDTAKVVFVARNPMDCALSFFHHERLVPQQGFAGSFEEYADLFRHGNNPMGNYFYHLKSGWVHRTSPNLKFLWYEEMRRDIGAVIDDLSDFLNVELSEEQKTLLKDHLSIEKFRQNDSVNMNTCYGSEQSRGSFIRKGEVGGWKELFNEEMREQWKKWIEENVADDQDLAFLTQMLEQK